MQSDNNQPKTTIEQGAEWSRDFELARFKDIQGGTRSEILQKTMAFIDEEVQETKEAIANEDRSEIIDGFGDIAFIALNGIYKEFRTAGDIHEVAVARTHKTMQRICDANNGKRQEDGTVKYLNGKVQKPEGWSAPQYADMLEVQAA